MYYKFTCDGYLRVKGDTFEDAVKFVFENKFKAEDVLLSEVRKESIRESTKEQYNKESKIEEKEQTGSHTWLVPVTWDVYAKDSESYTYKIKQKILDSGWTEAGNYVVRNQRTASTKTVEDAIKGAKKKIYSKESPTNMAEIVMSFCKEFLPNEYEAALSDDSTLEDYIAITMEDFKNQYAIKYYIDFLEEIFPNLHSCYQILEFETVYFFLENRLEVMKFIDLSLVTDEAFKWRFA